ncbi:MAG: type II toxin-antitoxin system VapC family toxin [Bacteroidia bacterium]|nr:type II toxin-antitoxin system VapC family toxin [Bacteroidia bacterium]
MKLIDTNILIYSAQAAFAYLRPLISDPAHCVSAFTQLEVLGYPQLKPVDGVYFDAAFQLLNVLPIDAAVIGQAILLRPARRMSAGDAIIAATALLHGLELQTRNLKDFSHIPGLALHNPVG